MALIACSSDWPSVAVIIIAFAAVLAYLCYLASGRG